MRALGVVDASALERAAVGVLVGDEHMPEPFRETARALGMRVLPLTLDGWACLRAARGRASVEPGALRVRYAREPDAVTQWRARREE